MMTGMSFDKDKVLIRTLVYRCQERDIMCRGFIRGAVNLTSASTIGRLSILSKLNMAQCGLSQAFRDDSSSHSPAKYLVRAKTIPANSSRPFVGVVQFVTHCPQYLTYRVSRSPTNLSIVCVHFDMPALELCQIENPVVLLCHRTRIQSPMRLALDLIQLSDEISGISESCQQTDVLQRYAKHA